MKILKRMKVHGSKVFSIISLVAMFANSLAPFAAIYPTRAYAEEPTPVEEIKEENTPPVEKEKTEETAQGQDIAVEKDENEGKITDEETNEDTKTEEITKETPIETTEGDILEDGVMDYNLSNDIEEVVEVEEIPTPVEEPVIEEPIIEEPIVEEPIIVEDSAPSETIEPEAPVVEEPVAEVKEYVYLEDGVEVVDTVGEDWELNEEGFYETKEKVKIGIKYVFPENEKVTVTFKKLPASDDDRSTLRIKEVNPEDLPEELRDSNVYAVDITTGMVDGDFEYDLTLPKAEKSKAEVSYMEDLDSEVKSVEEGDASVSQKEDSDLVEIEDLDHMTVFVVVNPLPASYTEGSSNCPIMTESVCYNTIQEAVDAAGEYSTIYVTSGTYYGTVHIATPHITLQGLGNPKPTIIGGFDQKKTAEYLTISDFTVIGATEPNNTVPSKPTGLTAKFQYDSENIPNGGTLNETDKPGPYKGNNLELLWDTPSSTDLVTGYRILATYPDNTTNISYQGPNTNAWLKDDNGFGAYGNGKYTYQVIAVNENGTSVPSDPFVIYYDTQIPTATLTSAPENNSYINGNFDVKGVAHDNVALKSVFFDVRSENGGTWITGCKSGTTNLAYSNERKDADISCTIDTRNLVNGTRYMLRIHAGDYAGYGNVNKEAERYFTMDREKPSVPKNGLPNNSIIHTNGFDFTWDTSTDVSTITYEFQSSLNPSQDDGVLTTELSKSGTLPTNMIHSSGASDGTWYWQVRAKDVAGNYSDWSAIWTVTIDTTLPTKPVITNTPDNAFTNTNAITVNWKDGDDQGTNPSGIKGYIIGYVFTSADGNTVTDWTSGLVEVGNPKTHSGTYGHGEGKYVIYVKTVDNAGNESPESEPYTITYDKTKPSGDILGIKYPGEDVQNFITNDNTPILYGTCADNNGVLKVEVKIDEGTSNNQTPTCDNGNWVSSEFSSLTEGVHTVTLIITDFAGNTFTKTRDVTIDTVAPTAAHTYFKDGSVIGISSVVVNNVEQLSFTGKYNDPTPSSGLYWDTFVIFQAQDDGSFAFQNNGKAAYCSWRGTQNTINLIGSTYNLTDPVSFTKCTSTLPDGTYYMAHQVYDNATRKDIPTINQYGDVLGLKFTVDTVAPDVQITAPTSTHLTGTVEIKGTVIDANPHHYWFEITNSSGTKVTGLGTVNETTSFTDRTLLNWDTSSLPEGQYTIKLEARDSANNKDSGSKHWLVVNVDHTNPTVDLQFNVGDHNFKAVFSENVNKEDAENPKNYFLNNWPGASGSGDLLGDASISYDPSTHTATVTFTNPSWYISPEQQWVVQDIHDLAGNILAVTPYTEYSTPKVAPETTISGIDSDWHHSDVTVELTCTDIDGSGCFKTYYSLDGGTTYQEGNKVIVSTEGENTIIYYSKDNAGNVETKKTSSVVKIDTDAPTSIITTYSLGDGDSVITNSWDGKIAGTASDSLSGVKEVKVSIQRGSDSQYWNGSTWQVGETLVTAGGTETWTYTMSTAPGDDTYTIKSHAIDNAGNTENSYTITIVLDKTIPEVSISLNPENPDGSDDWYKNKPEITLTATDTNSSDKVEYQWGSDTGSWTAYTSPFEPDSEGKLVLYYRSIDKAGNESVGVKNIKVDTDHPSSVTDVKATYNESENSITLDWNVDDSDIKDVSVYKGKSSDFDTDSSNRISKQSADDENYTDNGDLDISISGGNTYYYKLVAIDSAGNRSNTKKVSIEIPKEGTPVVAIEEGVVEGVGAGEEEEGQVAGEGTGPEGEGVVKGAESEEGNVLGEETAKALGEQSVFKSFWFWFVLVVSGALVIWFINKKSENGTKTKKRYM